MTSMNRRTFVTAAAAARILGANDRIRAGLIGSGGRGRYVAEQFREMGADMVAVADIYEPNLQAGLKSASTGAKGYDNYRRLLEVKLASLGVAVGGDAAAAGAAQ